MSEPRAEMTRPAEPAIAVIGGGVIGLSIAWRLGARGHNVAVIDDAPGTGTSWVAGGMLASTCEVGFAEERSAKLLHDAALRWPSFLEHLSKASGRSLSFCATRSILVGLDRGDRGAINQLVAFQRQLGLDAEHIGRDELRLIAPLLSTRFEGAVIVDNDRAIDNREIVTALEIAARRAGVEMITARASAVTPTRGSFDVVTTRGVINASVVIVATGADEHQLTLPIRTLALRPVKGQILRISSPTGTCHLDVVVRAQVRGRSCYLVPRPDGSLVIGATMSEQGFDRRVETGAVFSLLDDARTILPIVDELTFDEASVGFRPATVSGDPVIGWTEQDGLAVAIGHYRNGFLLAPITAEHLCDLVEGGAGVASLGPFGVARD